MLPELIILGLGSNVGERQEFLEQAIDALCDHPDLELQNIRCSSIMETPALLPENAPPEWNVPFLNMVLSGETLAPPEVALHAVKQIELDLGRQERGRWGPREIDIDILALGDQRVDSPQLSIPHPEMTKRAFVMIPLAEILPEWRHPGLSLSARDIAEKLAK